MSQNHDGNQSETGEVPDEMPGSSKPIVDDPELDALLDDALKDMGKPLPQPKKPQPPTTAGSNPFGLDDPDADLNQAWTEEFIQAATAQFEKKMREFVQKGGTGPNPSGSSVGGDPLSKIVEAAAQATAAEAGSGFAGSLNSTLEDFASKPDLLQQAGAAGFNDDDLEKLMSSFSLGGDDLDDKQMDDMMPFMTNMMQKLLSKELLQPVLADIVERYPDWLAEHREKLSGADFDKYNSQYEYMKKICEEYAKEKDTDSAEVKTQRFDRISELMLKVQCSGPPPKELVGDVEGASAAGLFNTPGAMGEAGDCSIV